jgi:hypothetical protein
VSSGERRAERRIRITMTTDLGATRASAGPRNERSPGMSSSRGFSLMAILTLRVAYFRRNDFSNPQSIRSRWRSVTRLVTPVVPQVSSAGLPAYASIRNQAAAI